MGEGETNNGAGGEDRSGNRILRPGDTFGNYRVIKCLCAGLLVNYYQMQHARDLREVTVGVLHAKTREDPKFARRLHDLQRALKGVAHEGVPKIRECGEVDGRHCVFLDAVEGRTLSHYFAESARAGEHGVGTEAATMILAQLLGILGHAHACGIDHRDLTSDHVFVDKQGGVQLLGLGIKAAMGNALFEAVVSASVSPLRSGKDAGQVNSFDIMSPEYRAGDAEDERVDIYAAGVLGYWLLTGRKPGREEEREPPSAFVRERGAENPELVLRMEAGAAYVEEFAKAWDRFFDRALARETDKRYQSCKNALGGLKKTEERPESERAGFIQRQIDRIPVPGSIRARGEFATRIYRLSVIGLVGLTLVGLAASFLKVTFTESGGYSRQVAIEARPDKTPDLTLLVEPPVARVRFVKENRRFLASGGRLELMVAPGTHQLSVSAPQHVEKRIRVEIAEDGPPGRRKVSLQPAKADLVVETEPGARVSVTNGEGREIELGRAGEDGRLTAEKNILAGSYAILVRKEGYEPFRLEDKEIPFGETTTVNAPLEGLPASLAVRTEPPGARVLVNDGAAGTTPLVLDELKVEPGEKLLVEVRLDGYRPAARRLALAAGEDAVVDFGELERKAGALRVEAAFAGVGGERAAELREALRVEIGGAAYAADAAALERLAPGERAVTVTHPDYRPAKRTVRIEDRDTTVVEVGLEPKPGVVRLELPPDVAAEVRLDGRPAKVDEGRVEVPAGESVKFELRMRNHLTMVRRFRLAPNETAVWEVEPVPIPGPERGRAWTLPYLGMEFAWAPPGEFTMGSPRSESGRLPNEGPRTRVRFTRGFWIGAHEVTQAEYAEVMDANPSAFEGPRRPADSVRWAEARAFCRALTRREREAGRLPEGYVYRLPTEAEWAYAARAGTSTPFFFGGRADASKGNFRGVYPRDREDGVRTRDGYGTVPVDAGEPNPWGLRGVHGNVAEWTLDRYDGRLPGGERVDPAPVGGGGEVALRGGSWKDNAVRTRSAARTGFKPGTRSDSVGFRVVLAPAF